MAVQGQDETRARRTPGVKSLRERVSEKLGEDVWRGLGEDDDARFEFLSKLARLRTTLAMGVLEAVECEILHGVVTPDIGDIELDADEETSVRSAAEAALRDAARCGAREGLAELAKLARDVELELRSVVESAARRRAARHS